MIHFFKIFLRFYNRLFSKDKVFVKRLRGLLGFTPANLGIFKLAFYHKSTTSDRLYAVQSNERLEYLGDAVLATIVAEYLFKKYPNSDEGFLTKMRSKIVKRQSLNTIADKMGLDVFLNQYNNTRLSKSMLGNALEALVGAVYLEKGYRATKNFVVGKILLGYLDIHELESYDDNYKSQLLEWCQKNGKVVSYKMVSKYKFDKRDRFKVAVLIDDKKLADADDFNKKSAEQTASEKAMKILGIIESNPEKKGKDRQKKEAPSGSSRSRSNRDSRSRDKSNDRKRDDNSRGNRSKPEKKSSSDVASKREVRPQNRNNDRKREAPRNVRNSEDKQLTNEVNSKRSNATQQRPQAEDQKIEKPNNSRGRNTKSEPKKELVEKTEVRSESKPVRTPRKPRPARNSQPAKNNSSAKESNRKPIEEDWEDINVDDIKPITPNTISKPVKKEAKSQKSNGTAGNKRKYYRRKPQKNNDSGNENNSAAKKELTD